MPPTSASVVIRIGRSRSRLACEDRLVALDALPPQVERVIDLQNRVLRDHAEQHQHAERGIEIQRVAGQ